MFEDDHSLEPQYSNPAHSPHLGRMGEDLTEEHHVDEIPGQVDSDVFDVLDPVETSSAESKDTHMPEINSAPVSTTHEGADRSEKGKERTPRRPENADAVNRLKMQMIEQFPSLEATIRHSAALEFDLSNPKDKEAFDTLSVQVQNKRFKRPQEVLEYLEKRASELRDRMGMAA